MGEPGASPGVPVPESHGLVVAPGETLSAGALPPSGLPWEGTPPRTALGGVGPDGGPYPPDPSPEDP